MASARELKLDQISAVPPSAGCPLVHVCRLCDRLFSATASYSVALEHPPLVIAAASFVM
jgi:hypothetical protein